MDSNKAGVTADLSQMSNVKEAEANKVKRKHCNMTLLDIIIQEES